MTRHVAGRSRDPQRRDLQRRGRHGAERAGDVPGQVARPAGDEGLYKERVKRLVIVDSGAPQQDPRRCARCWRSGPRPLVFCGREVGEALPFPAREIEKEFAWAPRTRWWMRIARSSRCRTTRRRTTWPPRTTPSIRTPASSHSRTQARWRWRMTAADIRRRRQSPQADRRSGEEDRMPGGARRAGHGEADGSPGPRRRGVVAF